MRSKIPFVGVALLVFASAALAGDEAKGGAAAGGGDQMAMWMAAATPGDAHKKLEAMVGTWDTTVKMWMDPAGEPSVTKGTSVNAMVLGGRWLEQKYEGEMMGGPFHGVGFTGYDNIKKQYMGLWMDTASTAVMVTTGADDGAGTMKFTGTMDDPMGGKPVQMKEIVRIVDADHHNFEMYMVGPDGQEFKNMEISYERKKS